MAFLDKSKANFAFKTILGKAHTSTNREIANETLLSGVTSSATRVWSQSIPTSGAIAINQGIAALVTGLALDPVSGAIIGSTQVSYRLKLPGAVPAGLVGKINPLTGLVYASGDYIGNIIPEAFGVTGASDYRPILYGNGIEIPPLDAADWILDPFSGIITREADADSLNVWATPLTMNAYVYIGESVTQTLQNIQSSILNISGNNSGISRTEVEAISAGLNTQVVQISGYTQANTNSINTLFSTYTNSTTTQDISAGLNSRVSNIESNYIKTINLITPSSNNINILGSGGISIIPGVNSLTISNSTSGSSIRGIINCDTINSFYTIPHSIINPENTAPVVSLICPTSASTLSIISITNRTSESFSIILSGIPATSGYQVSWYMDLNDTANLSNYALTSTVSSISANLQNQINQLAPISTIVTGISSSNIIVDTTNTFNTFGSGEWLINANNGISSRTSKILANWNSFGVTFTESSTTDLSGSTNNLIFDMDNVASTIRLKATSLLGNWTIKFRKDIL